ncbi:Uncharacterized protein LW93_3338 [Fusarium fujikuroi]|nr:Uncharacterized protein LW93_3338 [Fusarium fujikuroi]
MRSVLRNKDPTHYQADNPAHFYSHLMVEYIWNVEADHGSKNANSWSGHSRPRSPYAIVTGRSWGTHYGNWKQLPFSYGPRESDIRRRLEHNRCTSLVHDDADAHERGTMGVDRSFSASKDYPHLSMWLQVSFTQNRVVNIWRGGSSFLGHETGTTGGLGVARNHTVGFDITGLTELLSCPRQFRKVNPYEAKFIKIVHRDSIKTVPVKDSYQDSYDFSWRTIAQAHSGLNIEWGKGFVPGVGPILSIAFSLGWTAVVDHDKFMYELSLWAPAVRILELFEDDVCKNSAEIRALTYESFWNKGLAEAMAAVEKLEEEEKKKKQKASGEFQSYFQQAHEVLRVDEAKYDKEFGADEEPGEVLVEVPPREGSTNVDAAEVKE